MTNGAAANSSKSPLQSIASSGLASYGSEPASVIDQNALICRRSSSDLPMSGLSGSGHHCDDDVMSANWDPLEGPPWLTVGLVVAVMLWLAEVALALDTVGWTPVYGVPGLVVAGVGLVAFRWLCKSWAQAFFWSALLSFAVMFGIMAATLQVY